MDSGVLQLVGKPFEEFLKIRTACDFYFHTEAYSLLRFRGERATSSPLIRLPVNFSGSRNMTEQPKHCQNSVWYQSPLRRRTRTRTYLTQPHTGQQKGGAGSGRILYEYTCPC